MLESEYYLLLNSIIFVFSLHSQVLLMDFFFCFSCFLELPTDLNTIQHFRHDKRFAEVDLKRPIESESVMLKDPFGIYFLLVEVLFFFTNTKKCSQFDSSLVIYNI